MCSPLNKWNEKSTLFPFTELNRNRLESCCDVLGINCVPHSYQMITGRVWKHRILMVPRRPKHSGYGMVTKQRSNHWDLCRLGANTHTGKYLKCSIPEELQTGSFCSRHSGRKALALEGNRLSSQDQHRRLVVMAQAQSD
jgi:hypothetical protein